MANRIVACVAVIMTLVLAGGSARAGSGSLEPTSGPARFATGFEQGNVNVDGGTIHYVRGGSGSPLLLIHGWPETWWAWHKVMPSLAREHTVIAVDLPGLGDSSAPPSGYDKATTARRIREAVHKLGFRRVGILAHDVGAQVAYPYARDFPEEVSRLAVLDSSLAGFGLEEDLYPITWHIQFNQMCKPIPEQIVDNDDVKPFYGSIYDSAFNRAAVDRSRYFHSYADPADRSAGFAYYRAIASDVANNHAHAAKRLRMPVLVMGGQHGLGHFVAKSFRNVADVDEVIVPGSGHFIPEEKPRFLSDRALRFFHTE